MADVRRIVPARDGTDGPRDRGQLILVTGLVIAVSMVVLALILNTVIFTGNLASRGTDAGGRDAIAFRGSVADDVGGLVDEENERRHDTRAGVEENVTAGIETLDDVLSRRHARRGAVARVNVSSLSTTNGTLVRQTDSTRALTNASGYSDWTLATAVPDTRAFTMTLDTASLASTDAGNASTDAFHVTLVSASATWSVYVYANATTGDLAVATGDNTSATEVCSTNRSEATVDLTGGTLAGEPCTGLSWPGSVTGEYNVAFANGADAIGTYDLTLNTSGSGEVNTASLHDGTTTTDSPFHVPALYSVRLDVLYEDEGLRYEAEVRIARGEPS